MNITHSEKPIIIYKQKPRLWFTTLIGILSLILLFGKRTFYNIPYQRALILHYMFYVLGTLLALVTFIRLKNWFKARAYLIIGQTGIQLAGFKLLHWPEITKIVITGNYFWPYDSGLLLHAIPYRCKQNVSQQKLITRILWHFHYLLMNLFTFIKGKKTIKSFLFSVPLARINFESTALLSAISRYYDGNIVGRSLIKGHIEKRGFLAKCITGVSYLFLFTIVLYCIASIVWFIDAYIISTFWSHF
jgi:hypothetical protein